MPKHFTFIIPRTPESFRNPLREALWQVTLQSLNNQTYTNWTALVITDNDAEDGNIRYILSNAVTKKEKIKFALEYIKTNLPYTDYLIRFDDDDVVNPTILDSLKEAEFDCYADKYQLLYDMVNDWYFSINFPWMPNSIIQGKKHAYASIGGEDEFLLVGDHDKHFQEYYTDKKTLYSTKSNLVYVRIYSPACASVSLLAGGKGDKLQFDMPAYERLLKRPKRWKRWGFWLPWTSCKWFDTYKIQYKNIKKDFFY